MATVYAYRNTHACNFIAGVREFEPHRHIKQLVYVC